MTTVTKMAAVPSFFDTGNSYWDLTLNVYDVRREK